MIDRFAKIGYARRASRHLGNIVGTTDGILTEVERNQILDLIDAVNAKAAAIEAFVTTQGSNLAATLGNWIGTWNTNWNKAQAFSPTVMQISLDLSSGDATLWAWDPTKDSTVIQWKGAVEQLYQIMQTVQGGQPLPPPGGGTPPPQPPPGGGTPASETSDYILYGALGLGGVAILGSIVYLFTR